MGKPKTKEGKFVISLDFELNWGVRDVYDIAEYGRNLLNGRVAIPQILSLFKRFDIRATWATVGLLAFSNRNDLMNNLPDNLPDYSDKSLCPYKFIENIGENEASDPYHFGYSLIREIEQTPGMEIGSHTFSHYYCLEKNSNSSAFYSDLQASHNAFSRLGITTESLVFCRNQYNDFSINIAKKAGFKFFRGNEKHWLYKPRKRVNENLFLRATRLSDHYLNISGCNSNCISSGDIINVPSSRFLRPLGPRALESIRLFRIKAAMTEAAVAGECFHLWWHPHNFGKNVKASLFFLQEVLLHFNFLRDEFGMHSLNMSGVMD